MRLRRERHANVANETFVYPHRSLIKNDEDSTSYQLFIELDAVLSDNQIEGSEPFPSRLFSIPIHPKMNEFARD